DSGPQLRRVLRFLRDVAAPELCAGAGLRLNVPNKRPGQARQLLQAAAAAAEEVPGAEVCLHYSLKYQPGGAQAFRAFCAEASRIPGCSVLLVSGTGRRSGPDSCACLEELSLEPPGARGLPPLGVAFSPFEEPGPERARLLRKLRTGLVSQVWLQLGSDLRALRSGLEFLAEQRLPGLRGSVFLPSRATLAKQRARPWAGVYLGEEYLASVEGAEDITRRTLAIFAEFGVAPLLESPVEDAPAVAQAAALLGSGRRAARPAPPEPSTAAPCGAGAREAGSGRRWGRGKRS
ncbi:unnamed protein product, partial [Prorocentrum cordatum]